MDASPTRPRVALGLAAMLVIGGLALWLPGGQVLRQRGIIQASQSFTLADAGPGRWTGTLQSGRYAGGSGLVEQRVLQHDRGELVELSVAEGLVSGGTVQAGDVLARLRTPQAQHRLAELEAEAQALVAGRALVESGGRPAEIVEARRRLDVAQARRDREVADLTRLRGLAQQGAVSPAELESAELEDQVRALQVDLARSGLAVAQSPARPEELQEIDANISAAQSRIAELRARLDGELVTAPFDGVVHVGGDPEVVRVLDLSTIYIRFAIPEADRHRVAKGAPVLFTTSSTGAARLHAELVEIGEDAASLNGHAIFFATARADNTDGRLRPGMRAELDISLSEARESRLAGLWREVTR